MVEMDSSNTPFQHRRRLGEMLVDDNLITSFQFKAALVRQRREGGFIGQILVEEGIINQEVLSNYLSRQCKAPHLSLIDYDIDSVALKQVPKELCLKHYMIPIDKLGRILTLAMVNPLDTEALEAVQKRCPDLRIKPMLCEWDHFQAVANRLFVEEIKAPSDLDKTYAQFGLTPPDKASSEASASETVTAADSATPDVTAEGALSDRAPASTPTEDSGEASAPPPGSLSEALRDSILQAIQAAQAPDAARETDGADASDPRQTHITAIVKKTLESITKSQDVRQEDLGKIAAAMMQAMNNVPMVQPNQSEQLTQIIQAALESVRHSTHQIEAKEVEDNNRGDVTHRTRDKHASVSPFPHAGASGSPEAADAYREEDSRVQEALDSERLLETMTFDNFFPGKVNAFTFKLGKAVAQRPGGEYNPLFLYGKVGVGKTHLMNAIGNAIVHGAETEEGTLPKRVGYVSASHFSRRLAAAISENALKLFRENYCHWDVLILDDIQFLGGQAEAQEEFFHIFNVLLQQKRQIIIAGDKVPDRLGLLEDRLVSRFASGIVAELKAPEFETRLKILKHLTARAKADVPDDVLELIARRVAEDVRKMNGAFRQILVFSKLEGGAISVESAEQVLTHLGADAAV